jgi:nucleotide-binding universal stress UspA family protein
MRFFNILERDRTQSRIPLLLIALQGRRVAKPSIHVRLMPTGRRAMFKSILVPIDLADTDLAKPAIATAATLSQTWSGAVRLLNVLPMTPVMLAEYVPADFDAQQRQTSEEALAIVARESGIEAARISGAVRQGGIYHEILEEAAAMRADLIVMTSHRPAMRTYFLGSNAGHVVRYAKCSVLVVRH